MFKCYNVVCAETGAQPNHGWSRPHSLPWMAVSEKNGCRDGSGAVGGAIQSEKGKRTGRDRDKEIDGKERTKGVGG